MSPDLPTNVSLLQDEARAPREGYLSRLPVSSGRWPLLGHFLFYVTVEKSPDSFPSCGAALRGCLSGVCCRPYDWNGVAGFWEDAAERR